MEYSVGDISGYAEQAGCLAHRETQPRHLPILSVHTHRKRRAVQRGRSVGVAELNAVVRSDNPLESRIHAIIDGSILNRS